MLRFPALRTIACASVIAIALSGSIGTAHAQPKWRDLNHNGKMDPYEDPSANTDDRVEDLLSQMTVEEKVAALAHGNLPGLGSPFGASDQGYDMPAVATAIRDRGVTSFITRLTVPPRVFAQMNNAIQHLAENTRLGIPVTVSTDPRNQFQEVQGATNKANGFSLWPDPIGLAAIDDTDLVREFGTIVRREYRAVGIHMALSPQADLTTDPRWPRIAATFGSDPARVSRLVGAEIEGLQGGAAGLQKDGVAAIVKHWVGYGTSANGFDAHNAYGSDLILNDAELARHVSAFKGAFAAHVAGVMPTYGILKGVTIDGKPAEPVGAGFSKQVVETMLRKDQGYKGLVVSDWAIVNDCPSSCTEPTQANPQSPMAIGMPWGVEGLSKAERIGKAVMAGVDQIGGLDDPAPILAALRTGQFSQTRLDEAVRHVMRVKFMLGLFDNPYVDPDRASEVVGAAASQQLADSAQRRAITLLTDRKKVKALMPGQRVWLFGMSPQAARSAGLIPVDRPEAAEIAIIRMKTPSERLHPWHFFGGMQAEGRTDFRNGDPGFDALTAMGKDIPAYVAVDMDRPAHIANLTDRASALFAVFGASDNAVLDVMMKPKKAEGKLPFDLP
ncbi:glycoside hydrolase family 3 protein [Novosphingobium mathurense]|uniref:beta-glucosidase n=1 Tax=Novosphingobium mathurense TaxID=428990 RepID=A0A1U6GU04_9SPHN|nr:glycoside hydrolase family 3 N-terminal domain-containing protein [Novosphingobium mathurense]SLJ87021.1 beta-glucosidase [Novosphingobium mathurense]